MKIIVWKGDDEDRYFAASTPEELLNSSREIVRELIRMQYVYDEELEEAESVLAGGANPWKWLQSARDGREYENYSLETVETPSA